MCRLTHKQIKTYSVTIVLKISLGVGSGTNLWMCKTFIKHIKGTLLRVKQISLLIHNEDTKSKNREEDMGNLLSQRSA